MAKVLFFNPPFRENIYLKTNVRVGAPSYPNLTLATLAGHLVNEHKVKIADLDLTANYMPYLIKTISAFKPDILATSIKTPDYPEVLKIMQFVKDKYPKLLTIIGGVHVTAFPDILSQQKCFDIAVIGEGDTVIPELLSTNSLKKVSGIVYRDKKGKVAFTGVRKRAANLNNLPFPAWNLFDLSQYKNSRLSSRKNPVGLIETSRGCAFNCNFCSKLTFGRLFRVKTPKRVIDEMEYMLSCGFKEIHIADDSFTQDLNRAKEVCREIIRRKLKFPWSLINGIRVNLVDKEFFELAKKAGCWQTGFGIESGDQGVLDKVEKNIRLSQVKNAVCLAEETGIDTFGFFIFGLSGETEKSMEKTIKFAKDLPLSTAKFDICIPYPGTKYFQELEAEGRIINYDWSRYNVHQTKEQLFEHSNLSWEVINRYYYEGFRRFYFRPSYIIKRFIKGLKQGDLISDLAYLLRSGF